MYRDSIINYIEDQRYIPETKALVHLQDWQKNEILRPLFDTKRPEGLRQYTLALVLVSTPKKNGKSTLAAGMISHGRRQNFNFEIGHFYSLSWFLTLPFPSLIVGNINSAPLFCAARRQGGNNC